MVTRILRVSNRVRAAFSTKVRVFSRNTKGNAQMVIGAAVSILMMLYIYVLVLSSVEGSIDRADLTSTMNESYNKVQANTATTMNIASVFPIVLIAAAIVGAFIGLSYVGSRG